MVGKGDTAPDFTLTGTQGQDIREYTLSEYAAGRPAVLLFYVYDFSPVCTAQVCDVNDMEFLTLNEDIAVLGLSPDGPYSHERFIEANDLSYPLLVDEEKIVYGQYGLIEQTDEGRRQHKRGIVVIDADRTIRFLWQAGDNWDPWEIAPMGEAYDVVRTLLR